jgi:protein translocase SecG subunit
MRQALTVIQIITSILLIVLVLIQARGTGFGRSSTLGGGTSFSRRGLEKLIFRMTFVVVAVFLVVAVLSLLV